MFEVINLSSIPFHRKKYYAKWRYLSVIINTGK